MVSDYDDPFLSSPKISIGSTSSPSRFDAYNPIILNKKSLQDTRFELQPVTVADAIALILILAL